MVELLVLELELEVELEVELELELELGVEVDVEVDVDVDVGLDEELVVVDELEVVLLGVDVVELLDDVGTQVSLSDATTPVIGRFKLEIGVPGGALT